MLEQKDLEQIATVAADAANKAVDKALNEPIRKFTPSMGEEKGVITGMVAPEDKLIESKYGGFKSMGHFFTDIVKADIPGGHKTEELKNWQDAVKKTAGYMEEGDLAQGGYTVPVEVKNAIMEKTLEDSIVRPRAYIQPMTTNRMEVPADVDADHSSNYFGGITIYRAGEGAQKTAKNPTFRKIGLTLHKLTGLCYVSDELLSDSVVALESYLTRKFGQSIAFVEDDDFLNGTGVNMAAGAFSSANPSLVTTTAVTGQGASTIIAENIMDMWAHMYPAGKNKAVWIANPDCTRQLMTMSLAVGTGGIPIWMPAGGLADRPYETLLGRPLIYSEKMQAIGTAGDIGLADFSQYMIGEKGGLQIASSIHIRFDYDETAFRFVLRYDGQSTWETYLTPKRGSTTLSPFVVLNSTRT